MSDIIAFRDVTEPTPAEHLAVVSSVAVDDLRPGVQLRQGRVNRQHVNAIALSDGGWPPIVVRRADNTIVDGHYRYMAARQLGHSHVECVYFEGGEESAFFEALRHNRNHGLSLSLRDRQAAARRILAFHPEWADRRISVTCGLAPGTVGRIRANVPAATDQNGQLYTRVGRDGRRRPVDPRASRRRVVSALRAQPERSLRETARATGTSPATVRAAKASRSWASDPAVLSSPAGGSFARWFDRTAIGCEWHDFVGTIPVSRIYEMADEARRRSAAWLEFASMVEGRVRGHQPLTDGQ